MKRRMIAEAAFQIALFLVIVTIGWAASILLAPLGEVGSRLVGTAVTMVLIITVLFNWSRIFDRLWPRPER